MDEIQRQRIQRRAENDRAMAQVRDLIRKDYVRLSEASEEIQLATSFEAFDRIHFDGAIPLLLLVKQLLLGTVQSICLDMDEEADEQQSELQSLIAQKRKRIAELDEKLAEIQRKQALGEKRTDETT